MADETEIKVGGGWVVDKRLNPGMIGAGLVVMVGFFVWGNTISTAVARLEQENTSRRAEIIQLRTEQLQQQNSMRAEFSSQLTTTKNEIRQDLRDIKNDIKTINRP